MKDLSYSQLLCLAQKIGPKLQGFSLSSFQEISPAKWMLHFSNHLSLLICLKHPFVRIHLLGKKVLSHSTPFCKKIESSLKNQKIASFFLYNADRILFIGFENGLSLIAELFSRGANLYLISKEKEILLSFVPIEKKSYSPPSKPKEHPIEEIDANFLSNLESLYQQAEENSSFNEEKESFLKKLLSRKKRLDKELQKMEQKTALSEKKFKEALLLKSHFHLLQKGLKKIELEDWQTGEKLLIALDPSLSSSEQLDAFFRKADLLKKEEKILEQKKEKTKDSLQECQDLLEKIEKISSSKDLLSFRAKISSFFPQKQKRAREFLEFASMSGRKIFIGRSDAENDRLTFSLSKGSDLWLHAADDPGSHVILKTEKGVPMDEESILDAANLALFYSKAKDRKESDILIAERKFLSRVKGKPGQVHMAKHKKLFIRLDLQRIERLKKAIIRTD